MVTTDTHVYFYSGREIYSNWHSTEKQFVHPCAPYHDFNSSEQGFMWEKARFFGDTVVADRILVSADPADVKMLGRLIKHYDDVAWECVRLGLMTYINYLKFSQNEKFAQELLDTGDRILVEASRKDRIWGVGYYETEPEIYDESKWIGRNLLGIALMKVRKLIRDEREAALRPKFENPMPSAIPTLERLLS